MARIVPHLLNSYQSKLINPVIIEFDSLAHASDLFETLAGMAASQYLTSFSGPIDITSLIRGYRPSLGKNLQITTSKFGSFPSGNERPKFFDRIASRFQNTLLAMKFLAHTKMIAAPLEPDSIDEVAQWPETITLYEDKLQFIYQTVPPDQVFTSKTGKPFTTTYYTKKLLGADVANQKGFKGIGITVAVPDTGGAPTHEQNFGMKFHSTMREKGQFKDSVAGYCPVIVKHAGEIDILPIEDLPFTFIHCDDKREYARPDAWYVYINRIGAKDWTQIKTAIRHRYEGTLKRINTRGGLVDVTDNHSLISADGGKIINAAQLKIGDRLAMPAVCPPNDAVLDGNKYKDYFFVGTEGLAWLYGFFAAEGSAFRHNRTDRDKGTGTVTVSNTDLQLLKKVEETMRLFFHKNGHLVSADSCSRMEYEGESLYTFFRSNFYTSRGDKKVPKAILNAQTNIKEAFLRGYNDGDGHKSKILKYEFSNFTTNSQTLAMGLIWLIKSVTQQDFTISNRDDKENIVQIALNSPGNYNNVTDYRLDRREVLKLKDISYIGYLYDFETDDHTFSCGVGPIRLHNTNGHGEWCVSCIGGKHVDERTMNVPVEGMAPECELIGIKCLGFLIGMGFQSDIMQAMEYAMDQNVDIVSMSLGSDSMPASPEDDPQIKCIDEMVAQGIIPVIAAGNAGPNPQTIGTPGCAPNALTVGAWDPIRGGIARFSSRGPTLWGEIKPDVLAPGVDIYSGCVGLLDAIGDKVPNRYSILSGTSMATPHVAGLLACAKQYYKSLGQTLTVDMVKTICQTYGSSKTNDSGWGFIEWRWFEEYAEAQGWA